MPETKETLDMMASEMFDLYLLFAIARSRAPQGPDDLSEAEFLTLDVLAKEHPLTIGDVQRRIGVLPAQMSRIVRALEEQGGRGYVECSINTEDRRRVDISLTESGKAAHARFRAARMKSMYGALEALPTDDRFHFMQMMRQIRSAFATGKPAKK
jgi:DNA-binding MarR family transcriptional regulator